MRNLAEITDNRHSSISYKIRWLYLGVGFTLLFIALYGFVTLNYLRQEVYAQLKRNTENLARSVEQTFDGMIDTIDVALLSSADEIERQQANGHIDSVVLDQFLNRQKNRVLHVANLRATDEHGQVIYGLDANFQKNPKKNSSRERDYFTYLRDHPNSGLYVDKPVIGRISNKWIWIFAERINKPDGRFGGIVYATVNIDEVEKILKQIRLESGGSIALRDREMGVIARITFDQGNPVPVASKVIPTAFKDAVQINPYEGSFITDMSGVDPIVRLYSYRQSKRYGYTVNVGLSLEAALHSWRQQLFAVGLIIIIFAMILLLMARKIHRAWKRDAAMIYALESQTQEIKQKHHALIDSELQHRALLEKLYTAIVVHAPDTRIIFSNLRAAELLGLSEREMLGKTVKDSHWRIVDEQGNQLSPEHYPVNRVLHSGKELTELVLGIYSPALENTRWVQVCAFPENDEQGRLKQIVVNFHDITARKEAQLRWQFALEGAGDGVWDIDLVTHQVNYSKQYLAMIGYADDEFPSQWEDWLEFVHPQDRENLKRTFTHYQTGFSQQYAVEYRMRCKNADYLWIYARGMIVSRDRNEKPLRMVGTHTDISGMKIAEEKIWFEANYDALTQLPNRRLFYQSIEQAIVQANRNNHRIAVFFIDLDRFKEINDTLGHDIGDQLLIQAAERINRMVGDQDTVARIGGDEFTVILNNIQHNPEVFQLAENMIEVISQPYFLGLNESYVSASIGISFYPDDADNLIDLIKNADQAMYSAKNSGRQCYRFFTKTMQEGASLRMRLANDLRHALRLQQLEVYYQPIVSLQDGKCRKAEALLRWNHPQLGSVSPSEFIPIAEDTGLIHPIGDWIFTQVIAQVKECRNLLDSKFQISVNKSPLQFFVERDGRQHWIDQLAASGVEGDSIVIEITEGVLITDDIRVSKCLLHYRDAGIQVAIDDFGTGYSSLSYLKKFDVDYLKIDQSFVQTISRSSTELALCEAIVVMAHKLDMQVIAEGVETAEQEVLLHEIGCDYAQGLLFSRPLPASQFIDFIDAHHRNRVLS